MNEMKKAFVFDFDDTLAKTDCRIGVVDKYSGAWKHSLNPAEFNSYKLQANEEFDFSDFDYVINPEALETLELAKQVHAENHDVYILTARNNKAQNPIVEYIRLHGINAKEVYCVGGSSVSIEKAKRKVLMTIMENYDKVYFYDDHDKNVEEAKRVGVKAYKV